MTTGTRWALLGVGSLAIFSACDHQRDASVAGEAIGEETERISEALAVDSRAGGDRRKGDPGDDGLVSVPGSGLWHFDDCSSASRLLVDSSGLGADAQQALHADCVPGLIGLGVRIESARDIILVPDAPQFTVSQRVAVAAWIHPDTVAGEQPIMVKQHDVEQRDGRTSFSLRLHAGQVEMSAELSTSKTLVVRAPVTPRSWTHVAGLYVAVATSPWTLTATSQPRKPLVASKRGRARRRRVSCFPRTCWI